MTIQIPSLAIRLNFDMNFLLNSARSKIANCVKVSASAQHVRGQLADNIQQASNKSGFYCQYLLLRRDSKPVTRYVIIPQFSIFNRSGCSNSSLTTGNSSKRQALPPKRLAFPRLSLRALDPHRINCRPLFSMSRCTSSRIAGIF